MPMNHPRAANGRRRLSSALLAGLCLAAAAAVQATQPAKTPPPAEREVVAAPSILVTDGGSGRVEIATKDGRHSIALDIQGRFVRTLHDSMGAEAEFRRTLAAEAAKVQKP